MKFFIFILYFNQTQFLIIKRLILGLCLRFDHIIQEKIYILKKNLISKNLTLIPEIYLKLFHDFVKFKIILLKKFTKKGT